MTQRAGIEHGVGCLRRILCGSTSVGWTLLIVGACAPVGNPIEPAENNLGVTGTIIVDGAPYTDGLLQLAVDDLNTAWFGTDPIFFAQADGGGEYEFIGAVNPALCDRLWLVIDGLAPFYRQQLPGCGTYTLDVDASINTRISGAVTLDGNIPQSADIFLAVDQQAPAGLVLRRLEVDFTDSNGEYSFDQRVAPEFCNRLWVWWLSHGVDYAVQVPACGTHVVDVAATS